MATTPNEAEKGYMVIFNDADDAEETGDLANWANGTICYDLNFQAMRVLVAGAWEEVSSQVV
jgi:hypothetical protein